MGNPNSQILLDRYQIESLIRKESSGGLYQAKDTETKDMVAVRRFFDARGDYQLNAKQEDAILDLAVKLGALSGEGLLAVKSSGRDEDGIFVIHEFREGLTLGKVLDEKPLDIKDFKSFGKQLLMALARLHDAGISVGAMGAASIQVNGHEGEYDFRISDPGWTRIAEEVGEEEPGRKWIAEPGFAAPEFLMGIEANICADLYSAGQLFFLAIVGKHPLAGLDFDSAMVRQLSADYGQVSDYRPDLPDWIDNWVAKFLEVSAEDRHPTAETAYVLMESPDAPLESKDEVIRDGSSKTDAVPTVRLARSGPQLDVDEQAAIEPEEAESVEPELKPEVVVNPQSITPVLAQTQLSVETSNRMLIVVLIVFALVIGGALFWVIQERSPKSADSGPTPEEIEFSNDVERANRRALELSREMKRK